MEMDKKKERIINFSLNDCTYGDQGYNRILIQLFGYLGHGKSSLINSIKYVLHDKDFTEYAQATSADGGLTMERKAYPLTNTITIVDNRGCSMLNSFESAEIYAQLGNFMPLNQKVEWSKGFNDMMYRVTDSDMDPNFTDIIVPIFVYSTKKDIAGTEVEEIKTFLKNCRDLTGMFPAVVLTHKTSGNFAKLRDVFEGMGAEEIIALENYTKEDSLKTRGRHMDFLKVIWKVLEDVRFYMKEKRNPKRERAERKKFLLQFIHDRDKSQ